MILTNCPKTIDYRAKYNHLANLAIIRKNSGLLCYDNVLNDQNIPLCNRGSEILSQLDGKRKRDLEKKKTPLKKSKRIANEKKLEQHSSKTQISYTYKRETGLKRKLNNTQNVIPKNKAKISCSLCGES